MREMFIDSYVNLVYEEQGSHEQW